MRKTLSVIALVLGMLPVVANAAPLNLAFSSLSAMDDSGFLQQVGTGAPSKSGSTTTIFGGGASARTASLGRSLFVSSQPNFSGLRIGVAPMASHVMSTGGMSRVGSDSGVVPPTAVSEPHLLLLFGLGLLAAGLVRKR